MYKNNCYKEGVYDTALLNAEESLKYAEGYPRSDIDKVIAL